MLLPHHHVVVIIDGFDGGVGEFYARRQHVRHHTQSARTERLRLGNHRPQHLRGHVFLHECLVVGQRHQLDGVGVEAGAVGRALGQQIVMDGQV